MNKAIPIVPAMFNPNDREIIKYSPPLSSHWFVAISDMAKALGIVTKWPIIRIISTPNESNVPTANPKR